MSPEQVEGKPLDPRSDIYSFGVTCYHMLTGSPPFEGETALGVAVQHLKKPPQPLETLRPDLPPALCRIVHQMLAKDPSRRFASARELLRELRRVQMEHFGDDWPDDLPAWDSIAAEMPPDPRIALTRQLDELMKAAGRRPLAALASGGRCRGVARGAGRRRRGRMVAGRRRRRCWPRPEPPRPPSPSKTTSGGSGIAPARSTRKPPGRA